MKYLTFMLGDQWCGIELSSVRELLGYMSFTPSSSEHPAIVGWFDLRGQGVRVMDLRVRLGTPVTRTDDTAMIVIESSGQTIAVIVDSVVGLENLAKVAPVASNKRPRIDARFVIGSWQLGDRSLVLLDIAKTIVTPTPLPRAA